MSQVAVRLYRLLHRAHREYRRAQIPCVGILGFEHPPVLDARSHLSGAFRAAPAGAGPAGDAISDGFRALRQAQQQLRVLKGTEEETREALRCWFQLCESWSVRLQPPPRAPSQPPFQPASQPPSQPSSRPPGRSEAAFARPPAGTAGAGPEVDVDGGAAGRAAEACVARLQRLAAALEEGALLVERLYDANHLSLEEYDEPTEEPSGGHQRHDVGARDVGGRNEPGAHGGGGGGRDGVEGPAAGGGGGAAAAAAAAALPAPLLDASAAAARQQLDQLAAAVAAAHPGLFRNSAAAAPAAGGGNGGGGGGGGDAGEARPSAAADPADAGADGAAVDAGIGLLRLRLEAISQVLFQELKFKHEPIEWVYDGLAPALLPQVLRRRRGVPLSLSVLYCCVARRLGVAALPVKATPGGAPSVAEGPAALHGLPPEVAARQAGRSVALAPPLDSWLVAAVPAPATHGSPGLLGGASVCGGGAAAGGPTAAAALYVDVDRRGRVMSPEEAARRYTELPVGAPLGALSPPEMWCELARLMVVAHTRRGESDLVAHWLVQVLALDHRSAEWQVMAGGS